MANMENSGSGSVAAVQTDPRALAALAWTAATQPIFWMRTAGQFFRFARCSFGAHTVSKTLAPSDNAQLRRINWGQGLPALPAPLTGCSGRSPCATPQSRNNIPCLLVDDD